MSRVVGKDHSERRWSIRELARASGLTVRTLHHYDEIGLLSTGERTSSGHRRYTEHDLRRLYRVRALRQLGLSLEEIADVSEDSADDLASLRDLLSSQLGELQTRAQQIERTTLQIRALLQQIDRSVMPDPDQFMTGLEMISVFDTYFTQQQQDFLAERRAELGEQAIESAKSQWVELVEQIRHHHTTGTAIDDPAVQALAKR